MAGLFERDQIGKREQLSDVIANVIATDVPFYAGMRKNPRPNQALMEFQMESYPNVPYAGVVDGSDVESFEHVTRVPGVAYQQHFRRPWKVSTFADNTVVAGLSGRGEKGRQKMLAMTLLHFMVESRLLCTEDQAIDDGSLTGYETRGAFSWMSNSAQSQNPVNADFRPPTTVRHTTALANLTEEAFGDMMDAAYTARRRKLKLDGIVGTKLKRHMDNWTVYSDAGASFGTFPVRQWNQEVKRLINCVDFLEFSTGTVRLQISSYLALSSNGASNDYSSRSGLFLDMEQWELRHMMMMRDKELEDKGGGPRGYCECILGQTCTNPLGQLVVYTDSDS